MASDTLRVPDPDEQQGSGDLTFDDTLILSGVLSCLLALGFFVYRFEYGRDPTGDGAESPRAEEERSRDPVREAGRRLRERRAARRDEGDAIEPAFFDRSERVAAAFAQGPRQLAETACRARTDALASGRIASRSHRALLRVVDRRSMQAPWSCLIRLHLTDGIDESLDLRGEIESVWSEIEAFRGGSRIANSAVVDFRRAGAPDSPVFDRWVRLCAMKTHWNPAASCRRYLRSIAPEQGSDLLEVVDTHLRETDLNPSYDLPILITGLKRLGTHGQPETWRIAQTEAMPDYDADLRIGSVLYLCRLLASPARSVRETAADALGKIARISRRGVDRKWLPRWDLACRYAFRSGGSQRQPAARLVEVRGGASDRRPRYDLEALVAEGLCRAEETEPQWYCAVDAWHGLTVDRLDDHFVRTRFLQWKGSVSPLGTGRD